MRLEATSKFFLALAATVLLFLGGVMIPPAGMVLLPLVRSKVDVPIIAAGGMVALLTLAGAGVARTLELTTERALAFPFPNQVVLIVSAMAGETNRLLGLAHDIAVRIEDLVVVLFLPAFFAFTGMRTQISLVSGGYEWLICGLIIVVATVGKFGGSFLAARITGLGWQQAAGPLGP